MKVSSHSKGFALVEGLLVIVAFTLICGVGYYVFDSERPNPVTIQPSQVREPEKASTDQKKYLEVKELAVKFELPENLSDAYYDVSDEGYVYVSVKRYDALTGFEACRADLKNNRSGLVAISHMQAGDDNFGSPWTEASLAEFARNTPTTKIGETYYFLQKGNGGPCYDHSIIKDTGKEAKELGEIVSAFSKQSTTFTKL